MEIKFSRHAKRRAKLYEIPLSTISNILKQTGLSQGEHELVKAVKGFKYPLKIVIAVQYDILTVKTNYPLKKVRSR